MRRILLLLAAVPCTLGIAYLLLWIPLECNRALQRLEDSTLALHEQMPLLRNLTLAELNIEQCRRCLRYRPHDARMMMVLAANQLALERHEDAIRTYEELLSYDRRPETYLQLGLAEARVGRDQSARQNLARAAMFNNRYLDAISDGYLRNEVNNTVQEIYARRGNLLLSGTFEAAEETPVSSSTLGPGPGSAASAWSLYVGSKGRVVTRGVDMPWRNGRRRVLGVTATCAGCGILQDWSALDTGPTRVRTTVTILVNSGVVAVGTGNFGRPTIDTTIEAGPEWRIVTAENKGCPANRTLISSWSGPAEFYLAEVKVEAIPGPPCDDLIKP